MKFIFNVLIFLTVFVSDAFSEDAFTASASKREAAVGEQIQVSFTLNGSGGGFKAPPFSDFSVLMGPNQSTSMQFVNGTMSQSVSFTFYLQAQKEGVFKIGPASIEVGGKRIQSNPLTITVTKSASVSQNQQRNSQQAGGDDANKQVTDNLMLKVTVDKANIYQGEGITATYKIFTRIDIVDYAANPPVYNGFWTQDITMPKNIEFHKENLDGVAYHVAEIKKVVLFPQRSGTFTLEPMVGEFIARIQAKRKRARDPFDIFNDPFFNDPFFGNAHQDVRQKIKSNTIKINVKPLPDPAPDNYGGAVGKFTMESHLDKSTTKTNEPISLKIKLSGKGNLKLIEAPKLTFPNDIESFDPKTTDNITVSAAGVSGSRTVEYLLIPRHSGEFKIDPVTFSYFDLDKKAYVSVSSPEFKIKVEKGSEPEAATVSSGVNKEDVQLLGKDIRFIKTGDIQINKKGNEFYGSPMFYSLIISPFLLFLGLIAYRRKIEELNSDISLVKSRKATSLAKKRLSTANKFLIEKNREKFYEEVSKALWGYVSDKITIPLVHLSKENTIDKLNKKNVSRDTLQEFINTIDHCDFARFAPPSGVEEMEKTYQSTIGLITKLEQEIKG